MKSLSTSKRLYSTGAKITETDCRCRAGCGFPSASGGEFSRYASAIANPSPVPPHFARTVLVNSGRFARHQSRGRCSGIDPQRPCPLTVIRTARARRPGILDMARQPSTVISPPSPPIFDRVLKPIVHHLAPNVIGRRGNSNGVHQFDLRCDF